MVVENTPIKDCLILLPKVWEDERGYFFESFNQKTFKEVTGIDFDLVQENESFSKYGVIRGLHAQKHPFSQGKIVGVPLGRVLDVVVDIRKDSPTFGKSFSIELNEDNKKQLFVPKGLLHGFSVLSESAKFIYKCNEFYNKDAEFGVRYDDPTFNIDWKIPFEDRIISEKDKGLPYFKSLSL